MTFPPPPSSGVPPLPPPQPALWAPRARGALARFCAWQDRRLARNLSARWLEQQDRRWLEAYEQWWMEHGWLEGAETPAVAWRKLRASRR